MRLHEYINESGLFKIDENGILWEFIAYMANSIDVKTYKSLIIPKEVKGFSDEFGREITVVDKFQLPCTLWDIGVYMHDWANAGRKIGCVFANCNLPRLLLPEEIVSESAGAFAFGNSYIQELCVPESYEVHDNEHCYHGAMLRALGFCFFCEKRTYEMYHFFEPELVQFCSWCNTEGPDEDGFGMSEEYDWWFLDELFNELPDVKMLHSYSFHERQCTCTETFDKQYENAKIALEIKRLELEIKRLRAQQRKNNL